MAHRYPLPYAFARSHQLLLEDDGTRLTLWLCPDSVPNAISEVMRKWGHAELSLDIAREDTQISDNVSAKPIPRNTAPANRVQLLWSVRWSRPPICHA